MSPTIAVHLRGFDCDRSVQIYDPVYGTAPKVLSSIVI